MVVVLVTLASFCSGFGLSQRFSTRSSAFALCSLVAQLRARTQIDLENVVYFRDETHYLVMTARQDSLLARGVVKVRKRTAAIA